MRRFTAVGDNHWPLFGSALGSANILIELSARNCMYDHLIPKAHVGSLLQFARRCNKIGSTGCAKVFIIVTVFVVWFAAKLLRPWMSFELKPKLTITIA
jgi:hypothetical protein